MYLLLCHYHTCAIFYSTEYVLSEYLLSLYLHVGAYCIGDVRVLVTRTNWADVSTPV